VTRDGRWLFFLDSEFDETNPTVSPDGHWLAHTSDVSGTIEVYVRRLTDGRVGPATRVTTGGGVEPC
jgi:Tol biopolymer transport system component